MTRVGNALVWVAFFCFTIPSSAQDTCAGSCECTESSCQQDAAPSCGSCRSNLFQGQRRIGQSFFGRTGKCSAKGSSCERSISDCVACDSAINPSDYRRGSQVNFLQRLNNYNSRYTSIFGGYVDLEDYDGTVTLDPGGPTIPPAPPTPPTPPAAPPTAPTIPPAAPAPPTAPPTTRFIEFNGGWTIGGKRGRVYDNGVRLEGEFSFRHNTIDTYSLGSFVNDEFVAAQTFDAVDSVYQLSTLTNVLVDLRRLQVLGTTPYVGVGVGGVFVDGDIIVPEVNGNLFIDDYAFAYQLIAGVNYKLRNNVSAFFEYKYFGTSGVDLEDATSSIGDFDLQSNNISFGLTFLRPRR